MYSIGITISRTCQSRHHREHDAITGRECCRETGDRRKDQAETTAVRIVLSGQVARVADRPAGDDISAKTVNKSAMPESGNQDGHEDHAENILEPFLQRVGGIKVVVLLYARCHSESSPCCGRYGYNTVHDFSCRTGLNIRGAFDALRKIEKTSHPRSDRK
jgi:hypothetical protein